METNNNNYDVIVIGGGPAGSTIGSILAREVDQGIESMRKLVYAFYNEGFSFSQFLRKYPEQRVNVINLLIHDVFRDGVDEVYGPMSDFAEIPPPLYEQVDGSPTKSDPEEVLSAKYMYFEDR